MLKSSGVAFVSAKMKLKRSLIFLHISTDILIWSRHFEGNYGYFQGNLKIFKKSRLWSWSDLLSNVMFGKQVYHEPTHKKKKSQNTIAQKCTESLPQSFEAAILWAFWQFPVAQWQQTPPFQSIVSNCYHICSTYTNQKDDAKLQKEKKNCLCMWA